MKTRFIDLSLPIEDGPSERVGVSIEYFDHTAGASQMAEIFGVSPEQLPEGLGWAGERITLITHAGTHMDAPYHYGPKVGGEPAKTIDMVPLEWCIGNGVVLDVRHKRDGQEIKVSDLEDALGRVGHRLRDGEIVLIMTGADRTWGTTVYPERGCGMGRASTLWLVEKGIRVIGIDAWGFDRPFRAMQKDYQRTEDIAHIWPAHFAGRVMEYVQLEKLTNLSLLPARGFRIYCFPIKISRASAAWCRVVAEVRE